MYKEFKVKYKFGAGNWQEFSYPAPLYVEKAELRNISTGGYILYFGQDGRFTEYGVRSHNHVPVIRFNADYGYVYALSCDSNQWKTLADGTKRLSYFDSTGERSGIGVDYNRVGCSKQRCQIFIKSGNEVVADLVGDCPVEYEVISQPCSAGYIEVPINSFPGYKCREICPSETYCQCDCGEVICCYGSDGRVLKTIPK